jgi:hypothetical protein
MAHSIDVPLQPYSQNSPLLNDAIDVYKGVWQERAIAMFEQRGWEYFARQFSFEGVSYPFVIMGKDAEAH